jgi:hypothetical protein
MAGMHRPTATLSRREAARLTGAMPECSLRASQAVQIRRSSMIRKSGNRFSKKIMLNQNGSINSI